MLQASAVLLRSSFATVLETLTAFTKTSYGEAQFPIQLAVLLSRPGEDFTGGEFVLTEQRPRRQSRARVISLTRGDGLLFAVKQRPEQGTRGYYRVTVRHGISEVHAGRRHALGVIFHDAR